MQFLDALMTPAVRAAVADSQAIVTLPLLGVGQRLHEQVMPTSQSRCGCTSMQQNRVSRCRAGLHMLCGASDNAAIGSSGASAVACRM